MGWTQPSLIETSLEATDSTQVIEALGTLLFDQGYVRDTFVQAVLDREKVFATGLPTPEIQVAIPHADVEHVLRSAIAIGVLVHPVEFGEMGNPEGTVPVRIVFMLAVKQSDSLVSLLQNLVGIFQNPAILHEILETPEREVIAVLFNEKLPDYQEA
ncbi:MAG: PTS sugar transporter subunit IIA [Anaerolineales bacterium]|jgi:PTS system galactitol-specific IIA component